MSVTTHRPDPAPARAAGVGSRRPRILVLLAVGLLVTMLVRAFLLQSVVVTSTSMEPRLVPGDRLLVTKVAIDPRPGDLVLVRTDTLFPGPDRATPAADGTVGKVLNGAASVLGIDLGERSMVLRVAALAGERVPAGAPAAGDRVPAGHVLVLTQVGTGGVVSVSDILGAVRVRFWPVSRVGMP